MKNEHSLGVLALTKRGCALAERVKDLISDRPVTLYLSNKWTGVTEQAFVSFQETVEKAFCSHDEILFIMATGIVVRSIAPLMKSKDIDPAVLVMDEGGLHIISLISGHLGGANELAVDLGKRLGARPVITTASDVSGKHAVDVLAMKYGLVLKDLEAAKFVTSLFVNDEPVGIMDPLGYLNEETFPPSLKPKGVLVVSSSRQFNMELPFSQLIPKELVLGMGCRKGTPFEKVIKAIHEVFDENDLALEALSVLATVDVKANEPGFLIAAQELGIELQIFSREELMKTEGTFIQSDFVKKTIGTGAVAEPCGYLASGEGSLLVAKTIKDGVTLSIWRRNPNV